MSCDAATLQFFQSLSVSVDPATSEDHSCWLEDMFKGEIPRLLLEYPNPSPATGTCILEQLGSFLTRVLSILSQLAKSVVHGEQVPIYARKKLEELVQEHDLSDLNVVDYLDDKHAVLKSIVSQLVEATAICSEIWADSPKAPLPDQGLLLSGSGVHRTLNSSRAPSYGRSPESLLDAPGPSSRPLAQGYRSLQGDTDNSSESPTPTNAYQLGAYGNPLQPDNTMIERLQDTSHAAAGVHRNDNSLPSPFANNNQQGVVPQNLAPSIEMPVNDLRRSQGSSEDRESPQSLDFTSRGSGHHTCPQGLSCTKGGVDPHGTMVVFERNSAFRAHLEKHEKTYKCDLPGCTNTKGFARIDQLRRHKDTVRHGRRVSEAPVPRD